MKTETIVAALAAYDPLVEWESDDGEPPFVYEGERARWEIHEDGITREEGCYSQTCDFIEPIPIDTLMRAMDKASAALSKCLRGAA